MTTGTRICGGVVFALAVSIALAASLYVPAAIGISLSCVVLAVLITIVTRNAQFRGLAAPPGGGGSRWVPIATRYGFALATVVIATALRWRLAQIVGPLPPFITLYPAVLLVATLAGGGPGVLASLLSAVLADYFFLPPFGSLTLASGNDVLALTIFTCTNLFLCLLAERLRRAQLADADARHNELLSVTLASIGDGVIVTDTQGRVIFLNGEARRLTGWATDEAQGRPLAEVFRIINEETRQPVESPVEKVLRLGTVVGLANHTILIAKDGRETPIDDSGAPVRQADGTVHGVVLVFRDFSEKKAAERALLESEERLRFALDGIHAGGWDLDLVDHSAHRSPMHDRIFGYETMLPRWTYEMFLEHVLPEDRELVDREFRQAVAAEHDWNFECRIIRHDGAMRWIWACGRIQGDPGGKPRRLVGIVQDITDRKRAEEEKAKLEAQLQQAQKMESVGRLAGGVAHDFNNMLGVIIGHSEVALEKVSPSQPLHEHLLEIRKAANRSAHLTRQLLAFARKQTIVPKVLDLNETVSGMLTMLERLIGEDIHLSWQPRPGVWPVRVDPSQLDQILANLCVNARDAIANVGKVTIETGNITFDEQYCADHPGFVLGEFVRLAVSDDGCGMDRETQSHLFEPFFTTKPVGQGTGLGLATVYGIVKQNNGFINVYSEPGQGTTFAIYLPRHASDGAQAAPARAASAPASRGQETILLVEDEPGILKMTAMMLQGQGYTVLAASTPGEATRLAGGHAGKIHLLMTDVVMPEMNGRDLAESLRAMFPNIKCLFMSGYTANVIAHHGVLDEGVHFIEKPFSVRNLADKVREAIGSQTST